ncbi:MAG: LytTR family DNA-binding domain-containing protein [Bacteroidales bacterium]|jgi:two-component system response regulator LytT|nr:LytTR family DNA-binding domain-containing protein [Bacteroidales bacterium]
MKVIKVNNPYYHIVYWIFIICILMFVFGRSWGNKMAAFYFISLLLPVIMATSYFFNYYLVPKFLLQKKYFQFGLYLTYTVVFSLFFEMIVLTFTFTYVLNFHLSKFNPNASDTLLLAVIMYLIVFSGSFILMVKQLNENNREIQDLKENKEKMKRSFIQVISQRKLVRIFHNDITYIESNSDCIKVYSNVQEIISKEKISNIEKKLPDTFLRIHRSFIVNKDKISRFDYNTVEINGIELNIGRTYKKGVMDELKS